MRTVILVTLSLLAAGTLVAATPAAEACAPKECTSGEAGPCAYGWRWAGTTDEQGFWYPYVECDL